MYFEIKNNSKLSLIMEELNKLDGITEKIKNIIIKELHDFVNKYIEDDKVTIEEFKLKFPLLNNNRDIEDTFLKIRETKKFRRYQISLEDVELTIYQYNEKFYFKLNYNIENMDKEVSKIFQPIELNEMELLLQKNLFRRLLIEKYKLC